MHKRYFDKYGHYSHYFKLEIDETLSEDEKNTLLFDIFNLINDKYIQKRVDKYVRDTFSNMDMDVYILTTVDANIKWRVSDNDHLIYYYTDVYGIYTEPTIYQHLKLVLDDLKCVTNYDKLKVRLIKPLCTPLREPIA